VEVEVAVLVILDVIETERGTEILTGIILEFLLQGEMNPFHHEVEVGVNVEEGVVEMTGVRDRMKDFASFCDQHLREAFVSSMQYNLVHCAITTNGYISWFLAGYKGERRNKRETERGYRTTENGWQNSV
jgi:hypothetical protein